MKNRNRPKEKIAVYLGNKAEFEGHLKFFGLAIIEGRLRGNISGKGTLEILKDGKIEADIYVSRAIIYGEIHGSIVADEMIEIKVPSKVFGKIKAPVLSIEAGAVFQGECHTQAHEFAEKDELGIESPVKLIDLKARKKICD